MELIIIENGGPPILRRDFLSRFCITVSIKTLYLVRYRQTVLQAWFIFTADIKFAEGSIDSPATIQKVWRKLTHPCTPP